MIVSYDTTNRSVEQGTFSMRLMQLGFRVRSLEDSSVFVVPPMSFIPAGAFLMGTPPDTDRLASQNEYPQHDVFLSDYGIGTYPLTVAEYACYLLTTNSPPPLHWEQQRASPDYPVVGITWNQSNDYARWLCGRTTEPFRLATEAQWEKAARGTDGRRWPWGNHWDASKTNSVEGGVGHPTPIGSYPAGASPYGCMDMAGNVLQWCHSLLKKYPYHPTDGREDEQQTTGVRVLRGGAWTFTARSVRTTARILPLDSQALIPQIEASIRIGARLVVATKDDQQVLEARS